MRHWNELKAYLENIGLSILAKGNRIVRKVPNPSELGLINSYVGIAVEPVVDIFSDLIYALIVAFRLSFQISIIEIPKKC